jgi:hypothetical protein
MEEELVMPDEIQNLERALKAKSHEAATLVLQRHLTLIKESQLKIELDKLKRRGRLSDAAQKGDDLERQIGLLGSYAFQINTLVDEAFELYRRITELEAEELGAQLQQMRAELTLEMADSGESKRNAHVLSKRIDQMADSWSQKQSEIAQFEKEESEFWSSWRERFLAGQLG